MFISGSISAVFAEKAVSNLSDDIVVEISRDLR